MTDNRVGGERDEDLLSTLKSWCQRELSKLLKSALESDLLDYLLGIEVEKDLTEYLQDMMGPETMHTKAFMEEFLYRWKQLYTKVEFDKREDDLDGDHQETQPNVGVA